MRSSAANCCWLLSGLLLLAAVAASPGRGAAAPASQPTDTEREIEQAIERLGDLNYQTREEASQLLWASGRSASSALQRALRSDDPEIVSRAQSILNKFEFGLLPDTPRDIYLLLDQYRSANPQLRLAAVQGLAGRGLPGARVLLGLRREERDERLRSALLKALSTHAHVSAGLLLADGDTDAAEMLLSAAAITDSAGARDWAAYLLVHGGLDDRIAILQGETARAPSPAASSLLAWMLRARGDLQGAKKASAAGANPPLTERLMMEAGDYKELAARVEPSAQRDEAVEELGFLAAYRRLSGDLEGLERAAADLARFADRNPEQSSLVANDLFLNDRPDVATDVLLKHHNYLLASDFLAARFRFDEALALPLKANGEKIAIALSVKALAAPTQRFLGDPRGARKTLEQVAQENQAVGDFGVWVALVRAAREAGEKRLGDLYCVQGLAAAAPNDSIGTLLEKAGLGDGAAAARWWRFSRQEHPRETGEQTLARVRAILGGELAGEELQSTATRAHDAALKLLPPDREQWQQWIADMLVAGGRGSSAEQVLREILRSTPSPRILMRLGDMEADRGDWTDAASSYGQAWEFDRTLPAPLFFRGWALTHCQREAEGKPLIELAHLISLGGDSQRHELYDLLMKRGLSGEAARERELICRVGECMSWERSDALRQAGDEASGREQFLEAASLWDQAFLGNMNTNTGFVEPWANAMIPALIHKTRAQGLIRAGKLKEGMAEAEVAMRDTPGDADAVIDVTNDFQKTGHRSEANAFLARWTGTYEKLARDHPQSGPLHNLLAWTLAKTGRRLDEAVAHGERAVALEPENTASLDTLAEAYFANHQVESAIGIISRCIALEPKEEHHRRQLARFQEALKK